MQNNLFDNFEEIACERLQELLCFYFNTPPSEYKNRSFRWMQDVVWDYEAGERYLFKTKMDVKKRVQWKFQN